MKQFEDFYKKKLQEAAETIGADVNEILLGYYLLGGKWAGFQGASDAKKQLEARKEQMTPEMYDIQADRAKAMAKETMAWAKENGYKGKVKKAWWTARPGILSQAVGQPVDSRKNPTDTLIQFSDGKFLGISAKSSGQNVEIGFKNPGIGTLDKDLGLNISQMIKKEEEKVVKKHDLPASKKARKAFIRENPEIQKDTRAKGLKILGMVRDTVIKKLSSMKQEDLRRYLLTSWMDAGSEVYPPYIKVTGRFGGKKQATADIVDPIKNPKLDAILQKPIKLHANGTDSIGVEAKGKRIMSGRAKYESEKIASSVKFSVEGWGGKAKMKMR